MLPFKSISPVKPIVFFTLIFVNRDIIASVNAPPAEGPSLGVAASGQCKCKPNGLSSFILVLSSKEN